MTVRHKKTIRKDNKNTRGADGVISLRLGAFVRQYKPGGYEVCCPVLDLWSQGDTVAEAKKNIAEATVCFVEGCYQMGTLDRVLLESGFRFPGQKEPKNKTRRKRACPRARADDKVFRFSAKVLLWG